MTNRARMKRILNLEERFTAAKLNALGWLQYAMDLKLEQLGLCRDGETRARIQLKLMEELKFLRENEGVLMACSDAFLFDEVPPGPETFEEKRRRLCT